MANLFIPNAKDFWLFQNPSLHFFCCLSEVHTLCPTVIQWNTSFLCCRCWWWFQQRWSQAVEVDGLERGRLGQRRPGNLRTHHSRWGHQQARIRIRKCRPRLQVQNEEVGAGADNFLSTLLLFVSRGLFFLFQWKTKHLKMKTSNIFTSLILRSTPWARTLTT